MFRSHGNFSGIRVAWRLSVLCALGATCACGVTARAAAPSRSAEKPSSPPPASVRVARTVVTPDEVQSIPEMFARAQALLSAGDFSGAATAFDRVADLDPDGDLAPAALFNSGVAHDQNGDLEVALARFDRVASRFPSDALALRSLVRSVRLLAFLERWSSAGPPSDRLIANRTALEPLELVVAYGGKALSLLAGGHVEDAPYFIEKGQRTIEDNQLDAAGWIPRDLAQLYFALGEIRRIRGEKIRFDPVPPSFALALEERCQLLLDAQSAYSDAMRARDAHWSAMAGYRVGELYERLHEDLMKIRVPAVAKTDRDRLLFEGAMHLRYSILLDKGLAMMMHTLQLAERTGERSTWVVRAAEAKRALDEAKEAEKQALGRLPFSRHELEQALEDLARRKTVK